MITSSIVNQNEARAVLVERAVAESPLRASVHSLPRLEPPLSRQTPLRGTKQSPNALNKGDFLQLLIAQMKNQNPLEPMSNQEFVAQLTAFSSLEQLEKLNQQFSSSVQLQKSQSNAAAMNLIGKKIKAPGDIIELKGGSPVDISYQLQSDANVTINIYDSSNNLVTTINAGIQKAGAQNLVWDGLSAVAESPLGEGVVSRIAHWASVNSQAGATKGKSLPDGIYTYEVVSTGLEGEPVEVNTFLSGQVSKMQFSDGGVLLFVGDREVNLSDVYMVSE